MAKPLKTTEEILANTGQQLVVRALKANKKTRDQDWQQVNLTAFPVELRKQYENLNRVHEVMQASADGDGEVSAEHEANYENLKSEFLQAISKWLPEEAGKITTCKFQPASLQFYYRTPLVQKRRRFVGAAAAPAKEENFDPAPGSPAAIVAGTDKPKVLSPAARLAAMKDKQHQQGDSDT